MNEFLLQIVTTHLFPLSDLMITGIFEAEIKFDVGYSMSSFLTLLESVNVLVVIWYVMKLMYLLIVKYSRIAQRVKVKFINTYQIYILG